jgi:hypothetical protein
MEEVNHSETTAARLSAAHATHARALVVIRTCSRGQNVITKIPTT